MVITHIRLGESSECCLEASKGEGALKAESDLQAQIIGRGKL